ncbi:hypothetical protein OEA41_001534 [Lepraria neglecta]|uniref:Uncharacterized protein n=1 Tax=Lepraria neglecta TaxID=209136 RepID=A0AAD9ZA92_9LECA|nr:hypothetical protein OEA41_001534 [Lepraria neglecta]
MNSDTILRHSSSAEAIEYLSTTPSSSSLSDDPNKQTLLNLTPELLLPATPARKTLDFFDRLNGLDPIKFSPPDSIPTRKSAAMPDLQLTYNNFANLNPFSEDRYTQMEDFQDARAVRDDTVNYGKKYGHRSPGMPHSQSEGNIDFRATARNDHSIRVGKKFAVRGEHNRSSEDTSATSSSFSRGRSISRTPSPTKLLENINEDEATPSPPKRSRSPMKQLFGERGWLGKSMSMKELPSAEYRKGGIKHWGGKLKERVEHLTEDVSKFVPTTVYHHMSPSKSPAKSKFYVSLSPPLQAKLYSEIELMICATANQYLSIQQEEGRMSVESLTKVTQFWASKNRPQVIEFMFDQATQRDLVLYNLKTFRFYGSHAENIIAMNTMMSSWKTLAREMSVRTFCAPDSMIKKHMTDCYRILEMLGAPLVTFLAFQEIQVKALKIMKEEQEKKKQYESIKFGVEKRWEPPKKTAKELEELENPFA